MITAWLTPLLSWLGLDMLAFIGLVIIVILIVKGD